MATMAWAFSTLAFQDHPTMNAISSAAIPRLACCETRIRDIANMSFAFATLQSWQQPLRNALSASALRRMNDLEPQSIAFLSEVGLDASKHPVLRTRLSELVDILIERLPNTFAGWRAMDSKALQSLRVDHLGSVGTRLLLDRVSIRSPDEVFVERAKQSFCSHVPATLQGRRAEQRRIFAYAEYSIELALRGVSCKAVPNISGRMLREHGFQGLRKWQKGWLKPIVLALNPHVDRSVCAEFQVLNELCDLVHHHGLVDCMADCAGLVGVVNVLASTTPCLSCVCAAIQYSLLFQSVNFSFSCVQPWHDGMAATQVTSAVTGTEVSPRNNSACLTVPSSDAATDAAFDARPLTATEHESLCRFQIELGAVQSWADVRSALCRLPPAELADFLRRKKVSVRAETLQARVERVFRILASSNEAICESVSNTEAISLKAARASLAGCSLVRWQTVLP